MEPEPNTITLGDCKQVLLSWPAEFINCCVTSPPYWGLRDYDAEGQIGIEDSIEDYVANMVEVFRGLRHVLTADGTAWLNLGDSYIGSWGGYAPTGKGGQRMKTTSRWERPAYDYRADWRPPTSRAQTGCKNKDMAAIPWTVALALRADGWYLRKSIIWNKPKPKHESVNDRPSSSHELIFLLAKSEVYYYNRKGITDRGDVWTFDIPRNPDGHRATFPEELPRRCISLGCPGGGGHCRPIHGLRHNRSRSGSPEPHLLRHRHKSRLCRARAHTLRAAWLGLRGGPH